MYFPPERVLHLTDAGSNEAEFAAICDQHLTFPITFFAIVDPYLHSPLEDEFAMKTPIVATGTAMDGKDLWRIYKTANVWRVGIVAPPRRPDVRPVVELLREE